MKDFFFMSTTPRNRIGTRRRKRQGAACAVRVTCTNRTTSRRARHRHFPNSAYLHPDKSIRYTVSYRGIIIRCSMHFFSHSFEHRKALYKNISEKQSSIYLYTRTTHNVPTISSLWLIIMKNIICKCMQINGIILYVFFFRIIRE